MRQRAAWFVVCSIATACNAPSPSPDATVTADRTDAISVVDPANAPAWAVRYGDEFWRLPRMTRQQHGPATSTSFDVSGVVDRVSHAITERDARGLPRVSSKTFTAAFDGTGVRFSPRRSPRGQTDIEARVRTSRIEIGSRSVAMNGPWSIVGNTAQSLVDEIQGIVEHHEVRADGVSISWIVRAPLPAGEDLSVELAIDDVAFAGITDEGVHYADATGTPRVRVGGATLVDATGERWPIATDLEEGRPRWRVPASLLATARFPITLDPTVSAQFGMDAPVAGAGTAQFEPALAFNGTNYLLVWNDDRDGSDLFGTLVSTTGVPADPRGFAIATPDFQTLQPAAASNGTDFFVVWGDERNGTWDVYGTRVSGAGVVLDGTTVGRAIATGPASQAWPAIASNGDGYFVAWGDGTDLSGAHVDSLGTVGSVLQISTATGNQQLPAVVSDGTSYFVVWSDTRNDGGDIYGAHVMASEVFEDPETNRPVIVGSGIQNGVAITSNFNGSLYYMAWQDLTEQDIYGARIDGDGNSLDGSMGVAVSTAASSQLAPAVASNGIDFLVAWRDNRASQQRVFATRVLSIDGSIVDGATVGIPLSTGVNSGEPTIAFDGTNYLVAWQDFRNLDNQILGTRVTSTGVVVDDAAVGLSLATGVSREAGPAVAASDSGFFVAWFDFVDNATTRINIRGARVSTTGSVLDPLGLTVSDAANDQFLPDVASDGTDYFVVWLDRRSGTGDIYGSAVAAATGALSHPTGLAIATATGEQGSPAIASNGDKYLVVWTSGGDIRGGRIDTTFSLLDGTDPGLPISTATAVQAAPSVASNGEDFLAVWQDPRTVVASSNDIYGARVTDGGSVVESTGFSISTHTLNQLAPAVASNGTNYLVVWQDHRGGSTAVNIFATRVDVDANVLEPGGFPLSSGTANRFSPSVASNGSDYLVAWTDRRTASSGHLNLDVFGTRVTSTGSVLDNSVTGFEISRTFADENEVDVAGSAGMPYLVTYPASMQAVARFVTDCGDGSVSAAEGCDDGNFSSGDGCSATCAVEDGYTCTGAPSICTDVDECATNNGGCSTDPMVTCTNTTGAFSCGACPSGYTGDGFTCTDVDECATNNGGCSTSPMVTCTNTTGSFSCGSCPSGYSGNGVVCTDVDECATNNGGCSTSPMVTCTNTTGSFSCGSCPSGYSGNGVTCTDVDECATNNGGCSTSPMVTCTNTTGSFSCGACPSGYSGNGENCSDVDECATNNGGCSTSPMVVCTNTTGSFSCGACPTGYTGNGVTCTDVDECATNNGGCSTSPMVGCTNTIGSRTCGACPTGYSGDGVTCTDVDECLTNNGGCSTSPMVTCTNTIGSRTCGACPTGYSGDGITCSDVDECLTSNGGCSTSPMVTCTNTIGSRTCGACPTGYSGDGITCTDVDECLTSNGGCSTSPMVTCTNTIGSRTCGACPTGYSGDGITCTDVDECTTNNGGCSTSPMVTCTNTIGSRTCGACPTGYSGDGITCTDVDECTTNNGGCSTSPMVTCTNTIGSRTCGACPTGYTGDGITCTDVNECLTSNGGCSTSPMVTCTNTIGSRTCGACPTGYSGDGLTCSDVDECATNNGGCSTTPMVTCTNTVGSRTCGACPTGYGGDGVTCSDVDECATNNGGCSTSPMVTCTNTIGSRTCGTCPVGYSGDGVTCTLCPPGYTGDGVTCMDIDECATNNGGCSTNPMVTCTNTPGSRTCGACPMGYVGNGVICAEVNECLVDNGGCSTDAQCTNTAGSRICTCHVGFTGDGLVCTDIDECVTNNGGCSTNATCENTSGSRTCTCNTGYLGNGTTCNDVDECASNNGGCAQTCNNTTGAFTCTCTSGYTLDADQRTCNDVNECASNNGGCAQVCNNALGSSSCSCTAGYTRDANMMTCTDVDECADNNGGCAVGVTCTNIPGNHTCGGCPPGYLGDGITCTDDNECTTNNAGCAQTCTNIPGDYTCSCSTGWVLAANEHACDDVDECTTNNGGCNQHCINNPGGRTCACDPGFELPDDETCVDVNECATNNGGCEQMCSNNEGGAVCACTSGYSLDPDGRGCTDIDECATNNGGCASTVACTNTPGAFTCGNCPAGTTGDGIVCIDLDECATNNGGCAQTCTNTNPGYDCSCDPGFALAIDEHMCADIDECATNNGGCSASPLVVCTNTLGSSSCGECPTGYSGDGMTCADVDECAQGACTENEVCANTAGSFTCTPIDEEEPQPVDSGCCETTRSNPGSALLALGVLAILRRRRRS